MPDVPLGEAIKNLRRELTLAMEEGDGQSIRFRPGPVELDLEVAITLEGEGEGSVKFWVLNFGAKASKSTESTHRLKITLQPVDAKGRDTLISDKVQKRPG
jgi:hypothetical protein